ncbi:DUF805 domain-containing protein [Bifidobacterium vespertilionis]|uniref:DUF805 domain-containing protein n=1 Tax=Bifidobacterium vespertilionis TaxID=2562524 RepID=A0A5J5DVZ1_9BIFI|nr:DUF805 domain-containing protein [Bifidobacterium vespertilionis]KAA8820812.1 DUF805 domain-containing protein [Bifidobacterium vespertilionis]KAA8821213.1 DUF805 domain-containing protein [Bifidobacterium vespertilionis]
MTDSQPNNQQPGQPEQSGQPEQQPTPTTPIPQYSEQQDLPQTDVHAQSASQQPTPQYGQYAPASAQQPGQQYSQQAPANPFAAGYQHPTQPGQPAYTQPSQPAYDQPAQPTPGQPDQPAQPEYGQYAPQQPSGQPTYGQYAPQPAYDQSGQPGQTAQPDQTTQPGQQPAYGQPQYGQYGQQAPANPFAAGYQQPGQSGQSNQFAPGQPLPQGAQYGQYAYAGEPPIDQPWYGISFGAAIKRLFNKAFVWTGRASRGEFWWAYLFIILVNAGVGLVGSMLGGLGIALGYIWNIAASVLLLFVGIRRLHDTNKSGWFMLIAAVPWVIDKIVTIVYVQPLTDRLNVLARAFSSARDTNEVEFLLNRFLAVNSGAISAIMVAALMDIISAIIMLVLLVGKSNPAGTRFDIAPAAPTPFGQPAQGAQPGQPAQPFGQPGQNGQGAQPDQPAQPDPSQNGSDQPRNPFAPQQ